MSSSAATDDGVSEAAAAAVVAAMGDAGVGKEEVRGGSAEDAPKATFKVPRSGLLDRVSQFLPALAQANQELERKVAAEGAEAVVCEQGEDDERPHVEMNLACGVLEVEAVAKEPTPEEVAQNTEAFLFSGGKQKGTKAPLVVDLGGAGNDDAEYDDDEEMA